MYIEFVIAVKADQIMFVAFMISEKQVLAMHTAVIFPPTLGFFNRLAFRV
jgi:hypothetical protein